MKPVMIIDDNPDILSAMEALLITEGIEPLVARDGLEAFHLMDSGKVPCVILLDNAMPKMNGAQFLAAMREHPKFVGIPVYVISASGDFDGSASIAGIAGFIHKPFDPEKVLAIVRRYWQAD
jgi:DNA-binding NtrC family response regulator